MATTKSVKAVEDNFENEQISITTLNPYIEKFESQRRELIEQIRAYEAKLTEVRELYVKLTGAVEALTLIEKDAFEPGTPSELDA